MTLRQWLKKNYTAPAMIVAVLGSLASGLGMAIAVGDTEGENLLSSLMFFGPAVAGAFPTLELAWLKERDLSMAKVVPRWFAFPAFGAIGAVVVMGITEIVLSTSGAISEAQAEDKYHYWFAADGPSPVSVSFGLLGYAAGLLVAIAVFVLVLWPLQIILRPHQALEENLMDSSEENFRRNRVALLLMPCLVINAFVIAIALTLDILWLAVLSIALEVVATIVVRNIQKSSAKRRAAAGPPPAAGPQSAVDQREF